jgi:hypothetical protein
MTKHTLATNAPRRFRFLATEVVLATQPQSKFATRYHNFLPTKNHAAGGASHHLDPLNDQPRSPSLAMSSQTQSLPGRQWCSGLASDPRQAEVSRHHIITLDKLRSSLDPMAPPFGEGHHAPTPITHELDDIILDLVERLGFSESCDDIMSPPPCSCHDLPRGSCPTFINCTIKMVVQIRKTGRTNMDGACLPVSFELDPDQWEHLLKNYFDCNELINAVKYSWDLCFKG